MISTKDLIKGEYYYCWIISEDDKFFIIKNDSVSDSRRIKGILISNMNHIWEIEKNGEACLFGSDRLFRVATYEERMWLDTCIKKDKIVDKEEIEFGLIYEIY